MVHYGRVSDSEETPGDGGRLGSRRVAFEIPIRTVAGQNSREHRRVKAQRVKRERGLAQDAGLAAGISGFCPPLVIRFTRVGKRKLDGDNLQGSCKALRDGVALALGIDDGDESLEWRYTQEKGRDYAVKVEVEEMSLTRQQRALVEASEVLRTLGLPSVADSLEEISRGLGA